jgi:hypothetical protein
VKQRAVVLVFTPANWMTPQIVDVGAVNDTRLEGDRVIVTSHSVLSADPAFNGAVVRNVEVNVHDNDLPGIVVTQVDNPTTLHADDSTLVLEGNSTTGVVDYYTLQLAIAPTAPVTVSINPADSRVSLSSTDPLHVAQPVQHAHDRLRQHRGRLPRDVHPVELDDASGHQGGRAG